MSLDRFSTIASILAAGALVACAAPEQDKQADVYKAPVYRTGSNLPAGRETSEPPTELTSTERKAIEDLQNRPRQPIGVTK